MSAQSTIQHWSDVTAAASEGPWEGDTDCITQHWTVGSGDIVTMEGDQSWSGCDHRIEMKARDAAFVAVARTAMPALLTIAGAVMSEAVAREVAAVAHQMDPADLGEEDQHLIDTVAAVLRRVVAQHVPVTTELG